MSTTTTLPPSLTTTFSPADLFGSKRIPCDFLHLGPITSTSACYPPDYEIGRSFYYSPGICPSGYSLACSHIVGKETRGTCCPTWYTCNTDTSEWHWYTTDQCTWVIDATVTYSYITSTIGGDPQTSMTNGPDGANALGIAIRYKQDDFAAKTSSASTSSVVHTEPTSSSHSRLSTGATAGIAVGAIIGGLAILGLIVSFVLRLRKTAASKQVKSLRPEEQYIEISSLHSYKKNLSHAGENNRGPVELYNNQLPSELQ